MSSLSLNKLAAITNASNLKFFPSGDSLKKYTGYYGEKKVLFRLYPKNDYYKNRYLREGYALRALKKTIKDKSSQTSKYSTIVPEIVKEWSNAHSHYSIRALTWIRGKSLDECSQSMEPGDLNDFLSILQDACQYMPKEFSFQQDVVSYLTCPPPQCPSYYTWHVYERLIKRIITINNLVPTREKSLIHGDLHYGNIIQVEHPQTEIPTYAFIDWEFSTIGSPYYDLAYIHVFSGWQPPNDLKTPIQEWKGLVIAIITHWYVINDPLNSLTHLWLQRLHQYLQQKI